MRRTLTQAQAFVQAHKDIRTCLNAFEICPVDYDALKLATSMPEGDFEDSLQAACAIIAKLDAIVTRDKGFQGNGISILSPAEVLGRIAK